MPCPSCMLTRGLTSQPTTRGDTEKRVLMRLARGLRNGNGWQALYIFFGPQIAPPKAESLRRVHSFSFLCEGR
jgi:hypothetical protein